MTLVLLDTNAYLRLAKRIRPLLGIEFGQKQYRLTVLQQVEDEVFKSPRLQYLYPWFTDGKLGVERITVISTTPYRSLPLPGSSDTLGILSYTTCGGRPAIIDRSWKSESRVTIKIRSLSRIARYQHRLRFQTQHGDLGRTRESGLQKRDNAPRQVFVEQRLHHTATV